ncbi:MAG: glycosyltransferase [Tolypothrix brevis GSE-NOS-MK-07-07A]|jgi:glycosyltransferase involved in cell wall biosynthesis|nr:glycosyltransferase [Tolypothrix brevis GSE-NOS-MK-07-07A]
MQELQTQKLQPIELPQLKELPLVSILIANYNYEKYIGETLESVLSQTYPNWEAMVCDDGSKDNSCEVIETYVQKDSRIKLIRQQNGGVASALNTTYRNSSGEIICVLDADDVWMPDKVQKVVEAFQSNPKGGFVIHDVYQIDGQGQLIKPTPMIKNLASGWMASSVLKKGGCIENIPPASALCIRREVTDLIFPMNEAFTRNADSLIFRLAPFVTEIVPVSEVLSKFRLHGTNLTSFTSLTPDILVRELETAKRIHQEQKQFLRKIYGVEVAESLTGVEANAWHYHDLYMLARFQGIAKSERNKVHRLLVTHPQFNVAFSYKPLKWLLQWGESLPNALFLGLFNQISHESAFKRIARLIVKTLLKR